MMWNCVTRDSKLLIPHDCACNMHSHQGQWHRIKNTTVTLQWRQSFSWPWPGVERAVDNWWSNCETFQVCFNIMCSYHLYRENTRKDKRPMNLLYCNKSYRSTWQWVAARGKRKEKKKRCPVMSGVTVQWCSVLQSSDVQCCSPVMSGVTVR